MRETVTPSPSRRISSLRRLFSPPRLAYAMSAVTDTPRLAAAFSAASMSARSNRKMTMSTLLRACLMAATSGAIPSSG